jgi:hypothetical protein
MNIASPHSRRKFLGQLSTGLGSISVMDLNSKIEGAQSVRNGQRGLLETTHIPARAKRVIYLFQSGGPSQLDLYDHKPDLKKRQGKDLPDSVRKGQRLTGMTAGQSQFPIAASGFDFKQHGQSGHWMSSALPHLSGLADDMCMIKTMHTEAINHDPAITYFQTGFQLSGRPSMGSWLSYGLGSANENLPNFVVMVSHRGGQPLYDRLWGSGFLPSVHQGVKFRSKGDPVLYLSDPKGFPKEARRRVLDDIAALNLESFDKTRQPEILTRISQYEMAFRMQSSIPELTDLSGESDTTFNLYGEEARQPGTFAHNCLMARRLTERGVRFVQLFHRGWDHHSSLPNNLEARCKQTDQASAALLTDLKQRGLLDDTLVVWGGEFGRTVYCQGNLTATNYGRDHHPRCFSMWMAGGGVNPGTVYGSTDDFSYNIAENPVGVNDLHATMLHLLGVDHLRLTFKFQGRHYRLTDIAGNVIPELIA